MLIYFIVLGLFFSVESRQEIGWEERLRVGCKTLTCKLLCAVTGSTTPGGESATGSTTTGGTSTTAKAKEEEEEEEEELFEEELEL